MSIFLTFETITWINYTKADKHGVTLLDRDGIDSIVTLYQPGAVPRTEIGSTITMKSGVEHNVSQTPETVLEMMYPSYPRLADDDEPV
jgi:hypothetical protein